MKIKSKIKNYNVNFSDSFENSLKDTYSKGDIVIIDKNVYTPLDIKDIHFILIDVSEKTKSFEGL